MKNVSRLIIVLMVIALLGSAFLVTSTPSASAAPPCGKGGQPPCLTPTPTPIGPNPTPTPTPNSPPSPTGWVMGYDASYVTRVEDRGGVYRYANGTAGDHFAILQSYNGVDVIRLRVWNNPSEGYNNKADVLDLALRAKNAGMKILVDFHYSDSWADPSQQTVPRAWRRYNYAQLQTAVYDYSAEVVGALIAQGTPPEYVQVGNEIVHGMLWDTGRVEQSGTFNTTTQWNQLAGLITSGINGVKSTGSTAKIIIHIDEGGETGNSQGRWFFDNLTAKGVQFDIIGISYYHLWHGDMSVLDFNIRDFKAHYGKPVMVMETSYMWTLGWDDWTNNVLGLEEHEYPGYDSTTAGQKAFFQAVVTTTKNAGGSGVFYWGGEWIAGSDEQDDNGSTWENQALFDFDGKALPALEVYTGN